MNASNDQELLSFPELAAGSVAVAAAVVLIAYHGLRVSEPPDLSAAVTTQSPSAAVSQARRHVPREAYGVVEQFILETGSRAWHNLVSSK